MKKTILEKLTSRKFIVTVITAITGIITMIIGENEIVQIIAGAAMTIIPAVVYCITEGVLDLKSVKTIVDTTKDAIEQIKDIKEEPIAPEESKEQEEPKQVGVLSGGKLNRKNDV